MLLMFPCSINAGVEMTTTRILTASSDYDIFLLHTLVKDPVYETILLLMTFIFW